MDTFLFNVVSLGNMADGRLHIVNMAPDPKGHMGSTPATMSSLIGSNIFHLFDDFKNVNEEKQTDCVAQLVRHFTENSIAIRDDDGNLSTEIAYTIKRLVRGLGSPKPEVLKTYFTALSCLLSSLPEITCEDVKLCIEKELTSSSESVSADQKEILIARTLAWGVLIRSGLLLKAPTEQQQAIFSDLLACSKKKSYLPLAAYAFLVDVIPMLETSTFRNIVWPVLKDEVLKPWDKQTLDSLLLLLVCRKHHHNVVKAKYLKLKLGTEDVLTEDTLKHFAQRLIFSTYLKHPLYSVFTKHISDPGKVHLLEKFWNDEIPKLLSTVKNKHLATLELFTNMIESVGPNDQIVVVFSEPVLSFLNHALSDSFKRLFPEIQDCAHKAVVLLGSVLTNPEASDTVRLSVLKALLFKSSNLEFEKISLNLEKNTHIITILIGLLESESAKDLALMFRAALSNSSQKNRKDIVFAVQQFSRLVYHSNIEEMDWRIDQLKFLIRQSFFRSKHSALTDDVAVTMKQSLFKALGTKLPTLENLLDVLNALVNYVEELLQSGASPRVTLNTESLNAWKKMLTLVKEMKGSKPGSVQQIFHLLFVYMGLYLFMDANMALDALKELHSCYEHSNPSNKKRKSVKRNDEPHWIEVTVELLLSLLSHGSNLLRTVVGIVFTHLRKHITLEALQQILEVLHPGESENALSIVDDANGIVESDGEGSSDDDEDDEEEVEDDKEDGNEDDSSDASSFEDDENSDLEDESLDEEESITDKLRSEIRGVLGNSVSDNESVDIDEADEEELRKVDEALVKAFQSAQNKRRSQKGKKNKKQSKVDELLMHFRLRVLDLIEIFLAKTPQFSLILPMIQPLLSLLEVSSRDVHMKSLGSRIRSLLNKISSLKKFPSLSGVTHAEVAELLTTLINKGNRTTAVFLETVDVVTDCCTMLVRCSEHLPVTKDGDGSQIVDICKNALESFLTKRDCLLPIGLFRSILTLQWEGCWDLADILVKGAFDNELRPIRRTHSIELLSGLFKNARLIKSETAQKKHYVENITSSLISNAVKFFASSGTNAHLQQKYVVGLYQALHLCVCQQKASPTQISELTLALNKFSEVNPRHGEAKKRFNELQRALACKNKSVGNTPKKEKLHSKNPAKRNESEENGHNREGSNDVMTSNSSVSVALVNAPSKKKQKIQVSQENGHNGPVVTSKKKRKNSQRSEGSGSVKKVKQMNVVNGSEVAVFINKNKAVNGVCKASQSEPSQSDGSKKKRKKKGPKA